MCFRPAHVPGQAGLLAGAEGSVYVEFGAGKGYLSAMLADCCPGVRRLALVDRRGFKLKADRWAGLCWAVGGWWVEAGRRKLKADRWAGMC